MAISTSSKVKPELARWLPMSGSPARCSGTGRGGTVGIGIRAGVAWLCSRVRGLILAVRVGFAGTALRRIPHDECRAGRCDRCTVETGHGGQRVTFVRARERNPYVDA